jgi:formate dehydrogenase (NADP+) beta subunit
MEIGRQLSFADLELAYDAVVVAAGYSAPQALALEGGGAVRAGLLPGTEFLRRVNRGERLEVGRRVAVVGGGNTAIDCARSARRLGAEVTVHYRRTEAEMPAIRDEVEDALAEGIRFEFQTMPTRVLSRHGRVSGLGLVRMEQGEPDASGRRRPVPVPGSEHVVTADTVLLAIGERAELGFLQGAGVPFGSSIEVSFAGATGRPGVFACGDVAFGHGTVTQAIATGRRVADLVAQYIERKGNGA